MTDEQAKVLFERYWAAFTGKDVDALAAHYGESGSFEDIALKFVGHGAGQVRRYWEAFNRALPDWTCDRHELAIDGGGFAVRYTLRGHLQAAFGPLAGQGEEIEIVFSAMVELGDDRIVSHRQYWNLTGALMQFGINELPTITPGWLLEQAEDRAEVASGRKEPS